MAIVWVPSLMRDLTGGQETIEVPGNTVGQVIARLDSAYPGIRDRLCREGQIVSTVAVHIDGRAASLGMLEPVTPQSEIQFLPAISGG